MPHGVLLFIIHHAGRESTLASSGRYTYRQQVREWNSGGGGCQEQLSLCSVAFWIYEIVFFFFFGNCAHSLRATRNCAEVCSVVVVVFVVLVVIVVVVASIILLECCLACVRIRA